MEEDLFMFRGCDGIWDVCSNENAAQTILGIFNEGESSLWLVCEEMMDLCLNKGSKDNMTAVLVAFPALKTKFEQLAQNTTTVKGIMARTQERARVAEESRKTKQHYRHRWLIQSWKKQKKSANVGRITKTELKAVESTIYIIKKFCLR